MKYYPHIEALLFDQPWAITPRALESMIARVQATEEVDLEAIATKLGRPLENTGGRAEQRGSTAILDVQGPIFRHADLMSHLSGATTAEHLARDFQAAIDNGTVENILLRIDSPGGQVNGIADLAEIIRQSPKPVTAYIDGLGASAAYWLAAAAKKIYGSVDSFIGSIGVVATLVDRRGAQERQGVKTYQIVSSQSPRKLADPATEEGHAAISEMVDSLGALFVDRVAGYRGTTAAHVLEHYGKGFVLPARLAEKAGMIDGVTSEEALIASLHTKTSVAVLAAKEESMEKPTAGAPPAETTQLDNGAAAAAERQRIQAILELPEAKGREKLAQMLAFEPGINTETAKKILASAAEEQAAVVEPPAASPLEREMAKLKNPKVGAGAESDEDAAMAEAQRILAFLPAHQKVARTA